jgi:CRP-like cAMP-binding protein
LAILQIVIEAISGQEIVFQMLFLLMDDLLQAIRSIANIPETEARKLAAITQGLYLNKGDLFLRHGAIPQKFAFVSSGLFRYFYVSTKGSEYTKGFFQEDSFIVSYSAMVKQTGSYYAIEALEESHVQVIDYHKWLKLYNDHPCWTPVLIALLQKGYMKKEAREREFLLLDAEERYRLFLQEYPNLELRIKQHHVASYLGITPVALSRIRGKIK